ncbi:Fungal specific transcription factor domain-containing protein [Cladophialophora immunda]|nr:Fungal specific transcription factor domain-containing protein [Cladophialophora immunda]
MDTHPLLLRKLRCDALAKFPSACSRCELHGVDCKIDSTFKRVSVRSRLDEMFKQMNDLQNNVEASCPDSRSVNSRAADSDPDCGASSTASFCGKDWILLTDVEANSGRVWCLGDVELSYPAASELLNFFANYYYEHLPMLDRLNSVSELHESNPLLFWSIVRTSSYRNARYTDIFTNSAPSFQELLSTALSNPICDFRTVQALIILCYWPNSGERQSQDLSWQFCGVALNAAMQMGMDQPSHERVNAGFGGRSNIHQMSRYARQMTWLALFCISTSLATWLGVTPHISSAMQLQYVVQMARDPEVPRTFRAQVEIQRQVVLYSTSLAGVGDFGTGSTLFNLFNNELDTVATTYKDSWTTRLEIQLLGAKLYLFSLCHIHAHQRKRRKPPFEDADGLHSDKALLHRGLPSAVSLIYNMSKLQKEYPAEPETPDDVSSVIHYPKYYFRSTMFAIAFLVKFLSANPTAAQEDRELAISHVVFGQRFFSSFPGCRDFSRAAEVVEIMAKGLKIESDNREDSISSRHGASILYDLVKTVQARISETSAATPAVHAGQPVDDWNKQDARAAPSSLLSHHDPTAASDLGGLHQTLTALCLIHSWG